jgi:hypothetical protein
MGIIYINWIAEFRTGTSPSSQKLQNMGIIHIKWTAESRKKISPNSQWLQNRDIIHKVMISVNEHTSVRLKEEANTQCYLSLFFLKVYCTFGLFCGIVTETYPHFPPSPSPASE